MTDSEDEYIGKITSYAEDLRKRIAERDRKMTVLPIETGRSSPRDNFPSSDHSSTTISSVPSLDLSTATILADHFNGIKKAMLASREQSTVDNGLEQNHSWEHRSFQGEKELFKQPDHCNVNRPDLKRSQSFPEPMNPQEIGVDARTKTEPVQQCLTDLDRCKLSDIANVSTTNHAEVFDAIPLRPLMEMNGNKALPPPASQPPRAPAVRNIWDPRWRNDKENRRYELKATTFQPSRPQNRNFHNQENNVLHGPQKPSDFSNSFLPPRNQNQTKNQNLWFQPSLHPKRSYEPKAPPTRFTLNPDLQAQPFHPFRKTSSPISGGRPASRASGERHQHDVEMKSAEPRRDNRRSLSQPPTHAPKAVIGVDKQENFKPVSILVRRPNDIPAHQVVFNEQPASPMTSLLNLVPEDIDKMTEIQVAQVVNSMYEGSPREKFKTSYPFLAEGVIQKDNDIPGHLRVYSSRVGKVLIPDTRECNTHDYVYFLVVREGLYRGCSFYPTPLNLISSKFPNESTIIIKGYAIVGKARKRSSERDWVVWSDSLGLMSVVPGAARTSCKKQVGWDMELDVVSIAATYSGGRFHVNNLTAMTNEFEKKRRFPDEAFLVQDMIMICAGVSSDDFKFYSKSLDIFVDIKRTFIDREIVMNHPYEIVVVPTFPKSTHLTFRGILLIENPSTFWNKRQDTKERLLMRSLAYLETSSPEQAPSVQFTLPPSTPSVPIPSFNTKKRPRVTFQQTPVGSL